MVIDHTNLGRLDLNLLVALDALLDERSVSRAAERLHISQPAMSGALGVQPLTEIWPPPPPVVPALLPASGVVEPPPHAVARSANEVTAAPASKRVLARIYFLLRKFCVDRRGQREGGWGARRARTGSFVGERTSRAQARGMNGGDQQHECDLT